MSSAQFLEYRGFQITASVTRLIGGQAIADVDVRAEDASRIAALGAVTVMGTKKWFPSADAVQLDDMVSAAKRDIDFVLDRQLTSDLE